jgi:hypothetical protein
MTKIASWITAGPGQEGKALAGVRIAARLHQAGKAETKVVFFGPGVKLLDEATGDLREAIEALKGAGVPILACQFNAQQLGASERLQAYGVDLQGAGDVLVQLTEEGYQVVGY